MHRLLPLLLSLAIFLLLAPLLAPNLLLAQDREQQLRDKAVENMLELRQSLFLYFRDHGTFPTTEEGIEALFGYTRLSRKQAVTDPWGNPYQYSNTINCPTCEELDPAIHDRYNIDIKQFARFVSGARSPEPDDDIEIRNSTNQMWWEFKREDLEKLAIVTQAVQKKLDQDPTSTVLADLIREADPTHDCNIANRSAESAIIKSVVVIDYLVYNEWKHPFLFHSDTGKFYSVGPDLDNTCAHDTIQPGDYAPDVSLHLPAPELTATPSLVGTPTTAQVLLEWTDVPAADTFRLWFSTDGSSFTELYSGDQTQFIHASLSCGSTYHYRVRAVNHFSDVPESDSAVVSVDTPIEPPINFQASATSPFEIEATWEGSCGAERYQISWNMEGEIEGTFVPGQSPHMIGSLQPGRRYRLRIKSVGQSVESAVVTTDAVTPLEAVGEITFDEIKTGEAKFSFDAVQNADKYTLVYYNQSDPDNKMTVDQEPIQFHLTSLSPGSKYIVELNAKNSVPAESITTKKDTFTTYLGKVSGIVTTPTQTSIGLDWPDVTNATYYQVRWSDTGQPDDYTHVPLNIDTSAATDHNLIPGKQYWYQLRAFNDIPAEGIEWSDPVTETTLVGEFGLVAKSINQSQIDIELEPVDEAINTQGVVNWTLYSSRYESMYNSKDLGEIPVSQLTFSHTGLKPGTEYFYRALVKFQSTEKWTHVVSKSTKNPVSPPELELAGVNENSVNIVWEEVDGVDFYKMYRIRDNTSESFDSAFIDPIFTTELLRFTDSNVTVGTTYLYRAKSVAGDTESDYSNELSAKVSCPPPAVLEVGRWSTSHHKIKFERRSCADTYEIFMSKGEQFNASTATKEVTVFKSSCTTEQCRTYHRIHSHEALISGDVDHNQPYCYAIRVTTGLVDSEFGTPRCLPHYPVLSCALSISPLEKGSVENDNKDWHGHWFPRQPVWLMTEQTDTPVQSQILGCASSGSPCTSIHSSYTRQYPNGVNSYLLDSSQFASGLYLDWTGDSVVPGYKRQDLQVNKKAIRYFQDKEETVQGACNKRECLHYFGSLYSSGARHFLDIETSNEQIPFSHVGMRFDCTTHRGCKVLSERTQTNESYYSQGSFDPMLHATAWFSHPSNTYMDCLDFHCYNKSEYDLNILAKQSLTIGSTRYQACPYDPEGCRNYNNGNGWHHSYVVPILRFDCDQNMCLVVSDDHRDEHVVGEFTDYRIDVTAYNVVDDDGLKQTYYSPNPMDVPAAMCSHHDCLYVVESDSTQRLEHINEIMELTTLETLPLANWGNSHGHCTSEACFVRFEHLSEARTLIIRVINGNVTRKELEGHYTMECDQRCYFGSATHPFLNDQFEPSGNSISLITCFGDQCALQTPEGIRLDGGPQDGTLISPHGTTAAPSCSTQTCAFYDQGQNSGQAEAYLLSGWSMRFKYSGYDVKRECTQHGPCFFAIRKPGHMPAEQEPQSMIMTANTHIPEWIDYQCSDTFCLVRSRGTLTVFDHRQTRKMPDLFQFWEHEAFVRIDCGETVCRVTGYDRDNNGPDTIRIMDFYGVGDPIISEVEAEVQDFQATCGRNYCSSMWVDRVGIQQHEVKVWTQGEAIKSFEFDQDRFPPQTKFVCAGLR